MAQFGGCVINCALSHMRRETRSLIDFQAFVASTFTILVILKSPQEPVCHEGMLSWFVWNCPLLSPLFLEMVRRLTWDGTFRHGLTSRNESVHEGPKDWLHDETLKLFAKSSMC